MDMNVTDFGVIGGITKAGRQRKTLIIKYKGKNGEVSSRETEPYEIKDGAYYGYDIEGGSIKRFTLTNILGTEITENIYSPRWTVKL
jgi:predicted DNA-binding transcriptional regulator YafY